MAYGINDNNKQKESVYTQTEADAKFQTKQDMSGYAPKNHAGSTTAYGIGTGTAYGHVKLGSIPGRTPSQNGVALDKSSGDALYEMAQNASQYPQLPIGFVVINPTIGSESFIGELMGYGTWQYIGLVNGQIWNETTHTYDNIIIGYAYKRIT